MLSSFWDASSGPPSSRDANIVCKELKNIPEKLEEKGEFKWWVEGSSREKH